MRGDDPVRDEEPEAEAPGPSGGVIRGEPLERLEHARHHVGGYRRAAVLHLEDGIIAGSLDADLDASRAVNDRVADEIGDDLRQAVRIPGAQDGVMAVHDDLGARIRGA